MSRQPLSVLVTPTKSGGSLCALLGSLLRWFDHVLPTQIVVVLPDDQDSLVLQQRLAELSAFKIEILLIRVEEHQPQDVAYWRGLAFAQAKHETAVFLEDNAIVESGWWQAWRGWAGADAASPLASGLVVPDLERLGWAETGVFYCEYGSFLPSGHQSAIKPLRRVAGNHWAVRRNLLNLPALPAEIDEHDWVQQYSARHKPDWVTGARVRSYRSIGTIPAFLERGRQGYAYGYAAARKSGWLRRLKMIHGGPAILLVQFGRLTGVVLQRRYYVKTFMKTIPVTFFLLKTWSLAEWAGWISGSIASPLDRKKQNRAENPGNEAEKQGISQSRVVRVDQSHRAADRSTNLARRNAVSYGWIVEKETL